MSLTSLTRICRWIHWFLKKKYLQDISPFCGAIHVLHIPWDSPLVWHLLTSWCPAWQLSHSLQHTREQALVGVKNGTYDAAAQSMKPGRCSTDWAMPARHWIGWQKMLSKWFDSRISSVEGQCSNHYMDNYVIYNNREWITTIQMMSGQNRNIAQSLNC